MSEKISVARSVENAIRQMILDEMKPGDRLPTESELGKRFNASRTSVREALRSLEASQVISKINGRNHVADQSSELFLNPLTLLVHLNEVNHDDLQRVRFVLESEAVSQAALNATEDEIKQMQDTVWMMQKPSLTLQEFIKFDYDLHILFATASHNLFLSALITDINTVLSQFYPRRCTLEFAQQSAIPDMIELVQCICAHQSERAREKMTQHLSHSYELLTLPQEKSPQL